MAKKTPEREKTQEEKDDPHWEELNEKYPMELEDDTTQVSTTHIVRARTHIPLDLCVTGVPLA